MSMVAALFVQKNGPYFGLPDVDPWDEARDATKYDGPWPVVAHPPCARWSRLAGLVEHRWGHKKGDDGGLFESALRSVRKWGGVLEEHPAYSDAWPAYSLPDPAWMGWQRGICGGWACHVEQQQYGHRARKATWLYGYRIKPQALQWGRTNEEVCAHRKTVEFMGKRERSRTPEPFRDLLLGIARSVYV